MDDEEMEMENILLIFNYVYKYFYIKKYINSI